MNLSPAPLFFEPNIRSEKASSLRGYLWGKPAKDSHILAHLPKAWRGHMRALFDETDIISERWMCSDDPEHGSKVMTEEGKVSFRTLLDQHGEKILGPEHIAHFGAYLGSIMKHLDTNTQEHIGGLSVQVHPQTGHPTRPTKPEMWKGEGSVYLGWKEEMTPEKIREIYSSGEAGSIEALMHRIPLTKDMLVLVQGGLIHAIRSNSFLSEWSKAPHKEDIQKGNLAQATVALWDRTDGKNPRPGKEDIEGTLEVLAHANTFRASILEELTTSYSMIFQDQQQNKIRKLFETPEVHVDELVINTSLHISLKEGGLPMYVEEGSIEILQNGTVLTEATTGSEFFLPYTLENVAFNNTGTTPAVLQTWYAPLKPTGRSFSH